MTQYSRYPVITSGTVTSVTASAPLASSGGSTPNISLTVPVTGTANHWVGFDGSGNLFALPTWTFSSSPLLDYGWIAQQQPTVNPDAVSPVTYGINTLLASISISDNVVNNQPYLFRFGIAFDEVDNGFSMGEFGMWNGRILAAGSGAISSVYGFNYLQDFIATNPSSGTVASSTMMKLESNVEGGVSIDTATGISIVHNFTTTGGLSSRGISISQSLSANTVGTDMIDMSLEGTYASKPGSHIGVGVYGEYNFSTTVDDTENIYIGFMDARHLASTHNYPAGQFHAFLDTRTVEASFTDTDFAAPICASFVDRRTMIGDWDYINGLVIKPTLSQSFGDTYEAVYISYSGVGPFGYYSGITVDIPLSNLPTAQPPVGLQLLNSSLKVSALYKQGLYSSSISLNEINSAIQGVSGTFTPSIVGTEMFFNPGFFASGSASGDLTNLYVKNTLSAHSSSTYAALSGIKVINTINDTSTPATITDVTSFYSMGISLQTGLANNITNAYAYRAVDGSGQTITNSWGLFIDSTVMDNYLGKSLAIGTSSTKVSNASIALEMGGTTKALRLPVLTTTQKNALTPLNGMEVYDSSLQNLCFYNGSSWITGGTVGIVTVLGANGFAGTVTSGTTSPSISIATTINAPVLAGNGTALSGAATTGSGSTVVLSTSPTFVTSALSPAFVSTSSNVASAGIVRLSATDSIQWRNAGNSGNNLLATSSDLLTYASLPVQTGNLVCRLIGSTSTVSSSQSLIKFNTSSEDSLSVYSGATGIITIPTGYAGNYLVYCQLIFAGTFALNTVCTMDIVKNGTAIGGSRVNSGGAVTTQKLDFTDIIQCSATDSLNIQATTTATGPSISNGTTYQNRWCVRYLGPL